MKINRLIAAGMMLFLITGSLRAWPVDELGETSGLRNRRGNEGPQRDPQLSMPLFSGESSNSLYQSSSEETPIDLSQEGLSQQFELACFAKADWEQQSQNPTMSSVEEAQRAVSFWNEQRERYQTAVGNVGDPELLERLEGLETACSEAAEAAQKIINKTIAKKLAENLVGPISSSQIRHPSYEAMLALQEFREEHGLKFNQSMSQYQRDLETENSFERQIETLRHQYHENEKRLHLGIQILHITLSAGHVVVHYCMPSEMGKSMKHIVGHIKHHIHDAHATLPGAHAVFEMWMITPDDQLKWIKEKTESSLRAFRSARTDEDIIFERLCAAKEKVLEEFKRRIKIYLQKCWSEPVQLAALLQGNNRDQLQLIALNHQDVSFVTGVVIQNMEVALEKLLYRHINEERPLRLKDFITQHIFKVAAVEKNRIHRDLEARREAEETMIASRKEKEALLCDESRQPVIDQINRELKKLDKKIKENADQVALLEQEFKKAEQKFRLEQVKALKTNIDLTRQKEKNQWSRDIRSTMIEAARELVQEPLRQIEPPAVHENPLNNERLNLFISNLKNHWAASREAIKIFENSRSFDSAMRVRELFSEFEETFDSIMSRDQQEQELEQDLRESCQHVQKVFDHANQIFRRSWNSPFWNVFGDASFGGVVGAAGSVPCIAVCAIGGVFGPIGFGMSMLSYGVAIYHTNYTNSIQTHADAMNEAVAQVQSIARERNASDFAAGHQELASIASQVKIFIKGLIEQLNRRSHFQVEWDHADSTTSNH